MSLELAVGVKADIEFRASFAVDMMARMVNRFFSTFARNLLQHDKAF